MREYTYHIGSEDAGKSIGEYLKRRLFYSSRTLTKLRQSPVGIRLGEEKRHARTVDTLRAGDTLHIALEESEKEILPSRQSAGILFEDDDILIYNKPPGMPTHTSCGHAADTLENVWAAHCIRAGAPVSSMRALNRLDRGTSGCVLTAKNRHVASRLRDRFDKTYCALVHGKLTESGSVDAPIWRPDPVDLRRTVDARGQRAVTEYNVIAAGESYSFLSFRLLTGRTHQIRVHMASLGHPVAGDALYGGDGALIARQALHCLSMSFEHPVTGKPVSVAAPFPDDLRAACAAALGDTRKTEIGGFAGLPPIAPESVLKPSKRPI